MLNESKSEAPKEVLKKDIDNGKFSVKHIDYDVYQSDLSIKNISLMGTRHLIMQLDSPRVPDAFKKLCKIELDKRVAAREAKAKE